MIVDYNFQFVTDVDHGDFLIYSSSKGDGVHLIIVSEIEFVDEVSHYACIKKEVYQTTVFVASKFTDFFENFIDNIIAGEGLLPLSSIPYEYGGLVDGKSPLVYPVNRKNLC